MFDYKINTLEENDISLFAENVVLEKPIFKQLG